MAYPPSSDTRDESTPAYEKDFQAVLGHQQAKRSLEIAAAGGHNVLMVGPPGCGKILLAETFPSILPLLNQESQFDVMSIYQLSGITHDNSRVPPFRDPHHLRFGCIPDRWWCKSQAGGSIIGASGCIILG